MFIPSKKKLPLNDCASCLHFKSSLYEAKLLGVIPRHFFLLFEKNSMGAENRKETGIITPTCSCDCDQCLYKRWIEILPTM